MPAGRPSEYLPEYAERAATLAINGATDSELADEFGVTVRTIYSWKIRHPEFLQAVRYGKEQADERVERSLFHRAVGFEYPAVKISLNKEGNPVFAEYREYFPPDPGAAKMWLTNRKPEQWRERIEHEHTGELGITAILVPAIARTADRPALRPAFDLSMEGEGD